MNKVLWITGTFPPINCGIGRQYKLAKYLPDYGWNPVVLAFGRSKTRPQTDYDLMRQVQHLEVHRTPSGEHWWKHRQGDAACPWSGWYNHALREGRTILQADDIIAIWSSALPYTCHRIALQLKREYGLPWVADFRDVPDYVDVEILKRADAVTTVNSIYRQRLGTGRVITHGFDPSDYSTLDNFKPSGIAYIGTLYDGRVASTLHFLDTAKRLRQDGERLPDICFAGSCHAITSDIKRLGLPAVTTGWLSMKDARQLMAKSDLLLFILGDTDVDKGASTGKLFDYMGAGRPVLAIAPDGPARDIINQTGIGTVNYPYDTNGIAGSIKYWLNNGKYSPDPKAVARYDIRDKAREMTEVLEGVVG